MDGRTGRKGSETKNIDRLSRIRGGFEKQDTRGMPTLRGGRGGGKIFQKKKRGLGPEDALVKEEE